jgi:hypothetical protein
VAPSGVLAVTGVVAGTGTAPATDVPAPGADVTRRLPPTAGVFRADPRVTVAAEGQVIEL